jgi:hypothetical protein
VKLNTSPGAKDDGPKSATNTFKLVHPEILYVVIELKSVEVGVGVLVGVGVGVSVLVGVLVGVSAGVSLGVPVGVGVGGSASVIVTTIISVDNNGSPSRDTKIVVGIDESPVYSVTPFLVTKKFIY